MSAKDWCDSHKWVIGYLLVVTTLELILILLEHFR